MSPASQDRGGGHRDDCDAHLALVLCPLLSQVRIGREINLLLFNYLPPQVAQLSSVISFCTKTIKRTQSMKQRLFSVEIILLRLFTIHQGSFS